MYVKNANIEAHFLHSEKSKKLEKNIRELNIYDLIKYAHIPEINHVLNVTRSMIDTGKLKEEVESYTARVHRVTEELVEFLLAFRHAEDKQKIPVQVQVSAGKSSLSDKPEVKIDAGSKPVFPPVYLFELTPYGPQDWGVTTIDPFPPPFDPHYEFMPQWLISQLNSLPLDPESRFIFTVDLSEVKAGQGGSKTIDLFVTRMSEVHIICAVSENLGEWRKKLTMEDTDWIKELENDPEAVDPMFAYLLYNDPEFSDAFIEAFVNEKLPELRN